MRWIWFAVAAVACFLSLMAGFTFGVNMNAEATTRYVLNWGSLGDWVSGLGALLAIVTTLYLTKRNEAQQEHAKKDQILVEQDVSGLAISIRFVSMGSFPTTIRKILLSKDGGRSIRLDAATTGMPDPVTPCRLEFKQDLHFSWRLDRMLQLVLTLGVLNCQRLEDLHLLVSTTTQEFRFPLDPAVCEQIRAIGRQEAIQVEFDNPG